MGDPLRKTLQHKGTGEVIAAISHDGGKTWVRDTGSGGEPGFDVPADLGTTNGPVPRVPARAAAQDPTNFDPNQLGATAPAAPERQKPRFGEIDISDVKDPDPPPGAGEAVLRSLGQAYSGNFGDEFGAVAATRGLPSNVGMFDQSALGLRARTPEVPKGPAGKEENAEDIPRTSVIKKRPGREENAEDIPRYYRRGDAPKKPSDVVVKSSDPDMAAQVGLQNEQRKADDAARAQWPKTSLAADVAGGVSASMPLAALGLPAQGAGKLMKLAAGAATAAPGGMVAGAGAADDRESMGEGALKGGGIAALFGGVGNLIPWDKAAQEIGDWASRRRLTSTGISGADYDRLRVQGARGEVDPLDTDAVVRKATTGPEEMGEALEETGMTEGITTRGYWKQAVREKHEAGKEIEAIVNDIQSVPQPSPDAPAAAGAKQPVTVDYTKIALELSEAAEQARRLPVPEADKIAKDLDRRAMLFNTTGSSDYKTAWETRVLLDQLSHDVAGESKGELSKRLRGIAGDLQGQIEEAVAISRPDLLEPLRDANKRYSTAVKLERYAGTAQAAAETGEATIGEANLVRSAPKAAGVLGAVRIGGNRAGAYAGRGVQQSLAAMPGALGYSGALMLPQDMELEE